MKHSQKRTFMDIEKMSSDEFKAFCRLGNKNHFTRIRKMPLQDLLFTMINRKGLTLALELRNYMKLAHPGVSISKPGYLKQRMKLNPDAFLELYKYHNRNFYADSTFSTYKNHLILAADGSDINIPTTTETLKLYGSASRKNTKPQAQIGLGWRTDMKSYRFFWFFFQQEIRNGEIFRTATMLFAIIEIFVVAWANGIFT